MIDMEATMGERVRIIPPQPIEFSRHDLDAAAERISARTGIDAVTVRKVLENAAIYREPIYRG
jgi:hypothetical protein